MFNYHGDSRRYSVLFLPYQRNSDKKNLVRDEGQLLNINSALVRAIRENLLIEVKYYAYHNPKIAIGKIAHVDNTLQIIQIESENTIDINMDDVVGIKTYKFA
ncbi:YolD-like family protein [Virgibacillus byunsanensis]|uniref:YolD-like family protein n=1 Tax=Virgibacillus byunsanensis TaxID=570945 RepID=A0ABW3LNM3_9BACI